MTRIIGRGIVGFSYLIRKGIIDIMICKALPRYLVLSHTRSNIPNTLLSYHLKSTIYTYVYAFPIRSIHIIFGFRFLNFILITSILRRPK
ncbi:hypothetical protein DFP73DRAFT_136236 [Morchella snyderi]|nr:hypothetical protein DFP73DRAFT_136236 [Morchella snyderi]